MRTAACHPDRKHLAKGLCAPCYSRSPRRKAYLKRWNSSQDKRAVNLRYNCKKVGITPQDFQSMKDAQSNRCAVCNNTFEGKVCIDHDHQSGSVRGLLCHNCNVGLGLMKDNPSVLQQAMDYLEVAHFAHS